MAKKENSRTVELQVNAALADVSSGDTRPDAAAYAYSAGGKLLDTKPLDAKGNASLKLPLSAQATRGRSRARVPTRLRLMRAPFKWGRR